MAIWRKKESAGPSATDAACYVRSVGNGGGRIPKGYVPMELVGDEGDREREERVLVVVHVRMLNDESMAALLEMSAQRFGYGQRGVLRIPCGVQRFEQLMVRGRQDDMLESCVCSTLGS